MTLTIEQLLYLHRLVGADMLSRYSGASGDGPNLAFERELLHLLNAEIGKIAMPVLANKEKKS